MVGLAVLVLRYGLDALDKTRTAFSDKKVRCTAHELVAFSDNKPPPPHTKWTHRVPHPVLIGHAASLTPY
jgi:hypothetical protein